MESLCVWIRRVPDPAPDIPRLGSSLWLAHSAADPVLSPTPGWPAAARIAVLLAMVMPFGGVRNVPACSAVQEQDAAGPVHALRCALEHTCVPGVTAGILACAVLWAIPWAKRMVIVREQQARRRTRSTPASWQGPVLPHKWSVAPGGSPCNSIADSVRAALPITVGTGFAEPDKRGEGVARLAPQRRRTEHSPRAPCLSRSLPLLASFGLSTVTVFLLGSVALDAVPASRRGTAAHGIAP